MVAWKNLVLQEPCRSHWEAERIPSPSYVFFSQWKLPQLFNPVSYPVHCIRSQPVVDILECVLLTPPAQVCPVLVLIRKLEKSTSPSLLGFCDIKFHTELVLIGDNWWLRQDSRFQSLWNAGGIEVSGHSPRSPVSLCGLAHIVCSFLSYLRGKICATCTS